MKVVSNFVLPLFIMAAAFALFTQCPEPNLGLGKKSGSGEIPPAPDPVYRDFAEYRSPVVNPERGWYRTAKDTVSVGDLRDFRSDGSTILFFETDFGDFLDGPLSSSKLNQIKNTFNNAREAGMSVIFRAAYSYNEGDNEKDYENNVLPEPQQMATILGHIEQLKPIFADNEDILLSVQAGFFGPWGEWHSSYYGEGRRKDAPVEPQYQRELVNALLAAVPQSVTVALRRPEYIRNVAGSDSPSNNDKTDHPPVTPAEAFGASRIARLSFHNDALMSNNTDMDTYNDHPAYPREAELDWISTQTRYTPMVGETNQISTYNDSGEAIALLDKINALSLNKEYLEDVYQKWKDADMEAEGMNAYDYITIMMGYRFVLNRVSLLEPAAGGGLYLDAELTNAGFGNLLKAKKFELVLKKGEKELRLNIAEDARFWDKNAAVHMSRYLPLPANTEPGEWEAYLSLSSPSERLAGNPAYCVRFSNVDIWDAATGLNRIGSVAITNPGGR